MGLVFIGGLNGRPTQKNTIMTWLASLNNYVAVSDVGAGHQLWADRSLQAYNY